jgi:hypothetical protein
MLRDNDPLSGVWLCDRAQEALLTECLWQVGIEALMAEFGRQPLDAWCVLGFAVRYPRRYL